MLFFWWCPFDVQVVLIFGAHLVSFWCTYGACWSLIGVIVICKWCLLKCQWCVIRLCLDDAVGCPSDAFVDVHWVSFMCSSGDTIGVHLV